MTKNSIKLRKNSFYTLLDNIETSCSEILRDTIVVFLLSYADKWINMCIDLVYIITKIGVFPDVNFFS